MFTTSQKQFFNLAWGDETDLKKLYQTMPRESIAECVWPMSFYFKLFFMLLFHVVSIIHSCIHSSIHPSIHSFIHSFISWWWWWWWWWWCDICGCISPFCLPWHHRASACSTTVGEGSPQKNAQVKTTEKKGDPWDDQTIGTSLGKSIEINATLIGHHWDINGISMGKSIGHWILKLYQL